jgi:hypothetical protein
MTEQFKQRMTPFCHIHCLMVLNAVTTGNFSLLLRNVFGTAYKQHRCIPHQFGIAASAITLLELLLF